MFHETETISVHDFLVCHVSLFSNVTDSAQKPNFKFEVLGKIFYGLDYFLIPNIELRNVKEKRVLKNSHMSPILRGKNKLKRGMSDFGFWSL